MDIVSRKRFLALSGGFIVGAGFAPRPSTAAAGSGRKLAVTVRDSHLAHVGAKTAWEAMRTIGADGAEVLVTPDMMCPNLFGADTKYSLATNDAAKRLADDANRHGLRVSSFALSNRFDERPDEEVKWVTGVATACKRMGVEAIRIDVVPRRIRNDEEFLAFSIDICKRTIEATAETGVRLGIENHGRKTNDVGFLERLFDGVGSDRLGLTLDTGNFYWFGYPHSELYSIYEKFAPRAFHTHCKTIAYPEDKRNAKRTMGWEYGKYTCPVYAGDVDFQRVVKILKKAGYKGDLCVENESLGKFPKAERAQVLAKEIAFLKKLA